MTDEPRPHHLSGHDRMVLITEVTTTRTLTTTHSFADPTPAPLGSFSDTSCFGILLGTDPLHKSTLPPTTDLVLDADVQDEVTFSFKIQHPGAPVEREG